MQTRREFCAAATGVLGAVSFGGGVGAVARESSAPTPGPRAGHALAFHGGHGAICLMGGDRGAADVSRERVWFWDGQAWSLMRDDPSAPAPPVASLVATAADSERGSVLAYGGFRVLGPRKYGAPEADLWELDASLAWQRVPAAGDAPGPRHHHAMAFDQERGRLVMFGGFDAADAWQTDTWEWDRRRWRRVATSEGPGPRAHHAMAYDAARHRIVLRGGTTPSKAQPNDTWTWDGTRWHRAAADGPRPGDGYRLAYDAARRVTVLFGGDTVTWDGSTWTRVSPGGDAPPARAVHALAYDPRRRRIVLYGGSGRGAENLSDTWEWDGSRWDSKA